MSTRVSGAAVLQVVPLVENALSDAGDMLAWFGIFVSLLIFVYYIADAVLSTAQALKDAQLAAAAARASGEECLAALRDLNASLGELLTSVRRLESRTAFLSWLDRCAVTSGSFMHACAGAALYDTSKPYDLLCPRVQACKDTGWRQTSSLRVCCSDQNSHPT